MTSRRRKRKLLSEINVVPYIDVMLVLLVVFMVAAPLMVQGVLVNLPETTSELLPRERSDPLIVSIKEDGVFFLEMEATKNEPLNSQMLSEKVSKILSSNPSLQVVVRGDGEVKYQKVMELMSILQSSGAENVGLITQPPQVIK
ncbi:MAG: protein TolR [Gammaproteobacteria bacterium]|nr:protein TolR [Gammaproteobacteria bacterium]|tara:strand:- start:2995 stop:3426 length:432 start_codon:yes stop_codon:yes gene_type:complete